MADRELNQLMAEVPSRMPSTLAKDEGAAWSTWPMRTGLGLEPGSAK
jgi:hypothetical protein